MYIELLYVLSWYFMWNPIKYEDDIPAVQVQDIKSKHLPCSIKVLKLAGIDYL